MEMFEERPNNLPFRAKDGLYMTWIPNDISFDEFVKVGIRWSKSYDPETSKNEAKRDYSLIDTFFGEFINSSSIETILHICDKESPFRILLIDPNSLYALARADAMSVGTAVGRSKKGIKTLFEAISNWALTKGKIVEGLEIEKEDESYFELTKRFFECIRKHEVPMTIKYYNAVPSGPRLFMKDILIAGHYCVDQSSLKFPWLMLVDNPDTENDSFDVFYAEFNRIWNLEENLDFPRISTNSAHLQLLDQTQPAHKYLISYHQESNYHLADHAEVLLGRNGRLVLRDETLIPLGSDIEKGDEIGKAISDCDTFILIWSQGASTSDHLPKRT